MSGFLATISGCTRGLAPRDLWLRSQPIAGERCCRQCCVFVDRVPWPRYIRFMTICAACSTWDRGLLCLRCRVQLRPALPVIRRGVRVSSGLMHEDTARRLVHLLKYQAFAPAGAVLATIMASEIPSGTTALIPVPRAWARRIRYGIDPAYELARRIAGETGLSVVGCLGAPPWWPSHAGSNKAARRPPAFRLLRGVPTGSLLVDDVVTTGATLAAAARVTGVARAMTATRADSGSCE